MERLTLEDLKSVCYDPWELCGMGDYCTNGCHEEGGCTKDCHILKIYRKLAEYEDLEEKGKLLKLPCAIGDKLYILTDDSPTGIEETVCEKIIVFKNNFKIIAPCQYDNWGKAKWILKSSKFEKIVFLSQEEAEAALKKRKNCN